MTHFAPGLMCNMGGQYDIFLSLFIEQSSDSFSACPDMRRYI